MEKSASPKLLSACIRAAAISALIAIPLSAQEPADTARPAPPRIDTVGPQPERRAPLSPRRAFLYSLAVPGYSQSILGRNRTGALIVAFEAVAVAMIRDAAADVREARRNVADSIPVSFVDESGQPRVIHRRTPFPTSLVRNRRARLEDWIAVLVANHFFAAADAYVASLLWDLPAEVAVRGSPARLSLALQLRW